jgi:hypothetical protein
VRQSPGIRFLAISQKRKKDISLSIQKIYIERKYPNAKCKIFAKGSCLQCKLSLCPTPMSQTYSVKIIYSITKTPNVYVKELLKQTGLPHVYSGNRLCLYYPGSGEWSHRSVLADTILPWASEWLLHYELWSITGKWHGGGRHATNKQSILDKNREH